MEHLTDILKEKYISKIILDYKDNLEYKDILKKYTKDGIIDWDTIWIREITIPLNFIDLYKDKVNWRLISMNPYCIQNINFVRKYKDRIDWLYITDASNVTEEFVEEFSEYVNWNFVSAYLYRETVVNIDFLKKYKYKINWNIVRYNRLIPEKIINSITKNMHL